MEGRVPRCQTDAVTVNIDSATPDGADRPALVQWWAQTIDCLEPGEMADFYAEVLGGRVTRREPGFAAVEGGGLLLNFNVRPGYRPPTWPSPEVPMQSHFEFVVHDPDAAAEQMLRLGATLAADQDPDDPHLLVMLDPAGHPFCLIRSSAAHRY
jgi:catechol 2,3-dioxygenase-like lactoylglutathione lyase family enzyme